MTVIFIILIYFFSIIMHEVAHGLVAFALGDPTAKDAGRLTLNPIPHIDPFGTILLPLLMAIPALFGGGSPIIFGWAKPVPFNPMYFRNVRRGTLFVAAAGVFVNLLMAVIFGLILRSNFLGLGGTISPNILQNLSYIFTIVISANLVLGIFNLFPIPPLDGSKILFSILPERFQYIQLALERYGIIILLLFIFLAPGILGLLVNAAFCLIVG